MCFSKLGWMLNISSFFSPVVGSMASKSGDKSHLTNYRDTVNSIVYMPYNELEKNLVQRVSVNFAICSQLLMHTAIDRFIHKQQKSHQWYKISNRMHIYTRCYGADFAVNTACCNVVTTVYNMCLVLYRLLLADHFTLYTSGILNTAGWRLHINEMECKPMVGCHQYDESMKCQGWNLRHEYVWIRFKVCNKFNLTTQDTASLKY